MWFVAGVYLLPVGKRETISSSVINLSVILNGNACTQFLFVTFYCFCNS